MPDTPHDAPPAGRGHREGTKVELRRLDAVHLYLRGHYKAESGRRLGVGCRTVRRDIDAVRAEWKAERITTFEAAVDELLARVGAVDVEAAVGFDLNTDFLQAIMAMDDAVKLMTLVQGEVMSERTAYFNLERGERPRPGVTFEQEQVEIAGDRARRAALTPSDVDLADSLAP